MSGTPELGTLRELHGGEFTVRDFISKPEPCGNPDLYWPTPTIPRYLMDPEKANEAQWLLNEGTSIVGTWGENESKKDSEEFQRVSSSFKEVTGVDAWEIISEARDQLDTLMARRVEI